MPRNPTGQVLIRKTKRGRVFALRFRAYGERRYVTLGTSEDGWGRKRAEVELENTLADVRRGRWQPAHPTVEPVEPDWMPTFHHFASDWLEARKPELRPETVRDYSWALTDHLLPFFKDHLLTEISIREVDRYTAAKAAEGVLSNNSINKTVTRLSQILGTALEYELVATNPAAGKRRRLKRTKPQRSWVEPEQLPSLLAACSRWHRPIVATMAGAGLRVGEACALNWSAVNVATGTITVRESKTEAGAGRQVDLPIGAADELRSWRAHSPRSGPGDPVFLSRPYKGEHARATKDNVGRRLKRSIEKANEKLEELGIEPISERVSPHSLRRLYASLRAVSGDDPVYT
ncbi:MAG: tyrosine-type recombinase/integrase, partial [Solirubrobacterales bacterium]